MRRASLLLCLPLLLVACKRKPPPSDESALSDFSQPKAAAEEIVDALTPPPPPPPPDLSPRPDTVNGDSKGPKPAELDAANAEGQRKLQGCLDTVPLSAMPGGKVRMVVRYTIGNDGKAKDIVVEGGSPEANACGKTSLEGVAFPKFEGNALANAFSLSYSRPLPPDQAGSKP